MLKKCHFQPYLDNRCELSSQGKPSVRIVSLLKIYIHLISYLGYISLMTSKLVRLLPLLHISPRIRSIVYNSIQNFTRSLVHIQSKVLSSICSSRHTNIRFTYITNNRFTSQNSNQLHNIFRLFDVLPNFPFTTSETMHNYYL